MMTFHGNLRQPERSRTIHLLIPVILAFMSGPAVAQTADSLHPPFAAADADSVIPKLAEDLEQKYVLPATGKRYADMLRRNLASGRYAGFASSGAFAEAVTRDLQAVARDAHLVLVAPRSDRAAGAAPTSAPPNPPAPIGKSGWIAPGVAYLEFRSFPSDSATTTKVRDFLSRHASARALIIDTVDEFSGGWVGEADVLFGQLFSARRDLVAIDIRKAVDDRIGGLPVGGSLRKVEAPAGIVRYMHSVTPAQASSLRNTKVIMLISHRTISSGEHIAFVLKQSRRATLIGEPTRGAGNVESDFPMPAGYVAVIPFGRAYDPRTGKGWEGTGVQPDIRVRADQALDRALQLTGVKMSAKAALARLQ